MSRPDCGGSLPLSSTVCPAFGTSVVALFTEYYSVFFSIQQYSVLVTSVYHAIRLYSLLVPLVQPNKLFGPVVHLVR